MKFLLALLLFVPTIGFSQDWDMVTVKNEIVDLKIRVGLLETKWDMIGAEKPDPESYTPINWKIGEPTMRGREVLFFGAADCPPCRAAEQRLGDLRPEIYYVDCSNENPLADRFSVKAFPTAVLVIDGQARIRCVGENVGRLIVGGWLNSVEGGGQSAAVTEFEPKPIPKGSSNHAYATTGYNPVQRCTVSRLSPRRWTWPGDLGNHLRQGHGFNPVGFSHSQLVTIHDNLHNTGRSGVTSGSAQAVTRQPVQYAPAYQPRAYFQPSFGGCPTCPR